MNTSAQTVATDTDYSACRKIAEFHDIEKNQFFNEVVAAQKPIVIRGFAKHWSLVNAGKESSQAFVHYLNSFYQGKKAAMVVAPPAANKRFYYNDALTDINFIRGEERIDLFLGRLLELVDRAQYPAIALQSALIEEILPGMAADNHHDFFPDIPPRIWIGNQGIVNTHYDGADNLACVIAGRRRFILFAPDQTANLYPGPLNFTPAGAPTSLVNIDEPDLERFPLFQKAWQQAYYAELGPGDAIFIPMLWWHHVESLDKVNGLVNYWWNGSSDPNATSPSPIDSLNIALLAMRELTNEQRNAWRYLFDHYLFKQGIEPTTYIPKHQHHLLGEMTPEYVDAVKNYFIDKLKG